MYVYCVTHIYSTSIICVSSTCVSLSCHLSFYCPSAFTAHSPAFFQECLHTLFLLSILSCISLVLRFLYRPVTIHDWSRSTSIFTGFSTFRTGFSFDVQGMIEHFNFGPFKRIFFYIRLKKADFGTETNRRRLRDFDIRGIQGPRILL